MSFVLMLLSGAGRFLKGVPWYVFAFVALVAVIAWERHETVRWERIASRNAAAVAQRDGLLRNAATVINRGATLLNQQSDATRKQAALGRTAQEAAHTALRRVSHDRAGVDAKADALRAMRTPAGQQTATERAVLDLGDL